MVNTRLLTQEPEYLEPATIQEAVQLLERHGPNAKLIAGGTDLLVQMKLERAHPTCLISLKNIPGLQFIGNGSTLRIGAATLLRDVLSFCSGKEKYAALFEALTALATAPIRNMGTLGGNLCNASPAADSAPPLLVLDARVKICGLNGERMLPMTQFFKDVNRTLVAPNEILTEIQIPPVPGGSGSAFQKISRVGADISKASVAVFLTRNKDHCTSCRIALGSVAPVPMRVPLAEKTVIGKKFEPPLLEEAGSKAADEIKPISDLRSTAQYRKRVAVVLVKEALWKAWERAGDESSE